MVRVAIFIPISRPDHLDRLFLSLEHLECDTSSTSLLAYVDGDKQLYEHVSIRTAGTKFAYATTIKRPFEPPTFGKEPRKKRIAAIKNESKGLIPDCDYVFGIEDDTIVPPSALSRLLQDYQLFPHAGFIEGVELGRWGVPYVGAWRADDVYEYQKLESLLPGQGMEEIDAGGFYCYLTKREHYVMPQYSPLEYLTFGPDIGFGLFLRQQGFRNYIDWTINCEHRERGGGSIHPTSATPAQVSFTKVGDIWQQKIA